MKAKDLKFINVCNHGMVDYSLVVIMWLSPNHFHFHTISNFIYIFASIYLLLPLLTNYPLGYFQKIKFKTHTLLEYIIGTALVALPWVANFYNVFVDSLYCIVLGLIFIFLGLLTDKSYSK